MTSPDPNPALFRRLPVIAAILDQDGHFIDVSDAWEARTGHRRDDIQGRRPEDLATPDSARRIREEHRPHFRRTGRLDNVPVEFLTADGATLELLVTSTVEHDETGAIRHFLSVFTEVSDRARLERRYRDLYQSTPAMLHTIDPEGRLTEVSNHWLDQLGYAREEVLGRSVLEFMTDVSRKPLAGRLREIIREGDFQDVPRQMVTRNGEVRDVLLSSRTERDARNKVVRTLVAAKDVTVSMNLDLSPLATVPFLTDRQMRNHQRANLVAALEAAGWRISGKAGAAELLGMRPSTLTDRMKILKIRRPARAPADD